jgi:molybdate transport system permease protein
MGSETLTAILLTFRVAGTATAVVALPAIALGWLLARREFPGKEGVAAVATLPLVLPPTAIGFLLLSLFAVDGALGRERLGFDPGIVLTWKGAVIAQTVLAFPLVVRTARVTFEAIDPRFEGLARTLGHAPLAVFLRFTVPMAARGLVAALLLGFVRAVGEFGATVVVAGSIPGRTQTLASAIYRAQQSGNDSEATTLVVVALVLGFSAVLLTERLARRAPERR